jgi:hypothetical protein
VAAIAKEASWPTIGMTASGRRWQPQSVEEHLALLRAAGFAHVDCFWKRLGIALIGAYRDA